MYKIIGGDQKEYGPVTAEQLRQWIAEGRVNAQTPVQSAGATEWKTLSGFPEFADALAAKAPPTAPPGIAATAPGLPTDILSRDYDLDIGGCIGGAWKLLTSNFGTVFGGVAVFLLIQIGISALANIPILGILISLASLVIAGPMLGGVYYFLLRRIRGQPAEIGDIFAGFRLAFLNLFLGYLVSAVLIGLSAMPGGGLIAYSVFVMVYNHTPDSMHIALSVIGLILAMIPAIYLSVCWMFSLPLIIDKQLDFWSAMGTSRKIVGKHWWLVFAFLIVCGLVNLAGLLACCVGLFVSMPVVFGAMMYAYETIFSGSGQQTS